MASVCGVNIATYTGKDGSYTLSCYDAENGSRCTVTEDDLMTAVCAMAELLGCDLSDI